MPLPAAYEEQFLVSLSKRTYSTKTIKAYKYIFRKACRELDEIDLFNPLTLLQYRVQMASGSVGIFDAVWGILRQTPIGMPLPSSPRKPRTMYPHPLYADVMTLGSIFGNDRLEEMSWGEADSHHLFDERAMQARKRAFEWFMGPVATPNPKGPILVRDKAGNAMRSWQIDYIINSTTLNNDRAKTHKETLGRFLEEMIGVMFTMNATAFELRTVCDSIARIGALSKKFRFDLARQDLLACKSMAEMIEVAAQFPVEPVEEYLSQW